MATRAHHLAKALLENIDIAEQVLQRIFDEAVTKKDNPKIRQMSDLLDMLEEAKKEK